MSTTPKWTMTAAPRRFVHASRSPTAEDGPWMATVMGLAWSGDLPLEPVGEGWRGEVRSSRSSDDLIVVKLLPDGRDQWSLRFVRRHKGTEPVDVTLRQETDGRDFLRFEIEDAGIPASSPAYGGITIQVGRRAELKRIFANSPYGLSYLPVLRKFIESYDAPNILEWGAGRSTIMMAEWSPASSILTIEHSAEWYEKCLLIAKEFPKVEVSLQRISLRPGESGSYVTRPFHREGTYDIVFIDGRLRSDCLAVARRVVSPGGVVLLHDAHRKNYREAISLFSRRELVSGTAILRP